MLQHEQDLKELFDKVTIQVPGSNEVHAITFDGFKRAVDKMMELAFCYGQQDGLNRASAIVSETFNNPL